MSDKMTMVATWIKWKPTRHIMQIFIQNNMADNNPAFMAAGHTK